MTNDSIPKPYIIGCVGSGCYYVRWVHELFLNLIYCIVRDI